MIVNSIGAKPSGDLIERIGAYWDEHIHDLKLARHPVGSAGFFDELAEYRFDKLSYLPRLVDFSAYRGRRVLEIGCGIGIDLARFAAAGARVVGVDLSRTAVELARKQFLLKGLEGEFHVMNGEALSFDEGAFQVVYAHGVLQYTADAARMIRECHRVLEPGGELIAMVYNRRGWLNALSKLCKVELEHEDAPVLEKYTIAEFAAMLAPFSQVTIRPERFPVKSRLHGGLKGFLFNTFFVGLFNLLPRPAVRRLGWHLMASAVKQREPLAARPARSGP